jgi:tRNA (guanine37-N1)-methyltransferase
MNHRALIVPRERGEEARLALLERGALRRDVRILDEGRQLALPIQEGGEVPDGLGEVATRDFPRFGAPRPTDYRELVPGTPEERSRLPRSFDVIGDIVLVRIPPETQDRAREIGAALLSFVPGARVVGADRGVHGTARRRSIELLAGEGGWRTRHRENGIDFDVDVARAYFSPRLGREHRRVADEVAEGDRVLDLCCGIGPFSVLIAHDGRAREVVAVDSNPDALELLRSTIRGRPYASRIAAVEADVAAFAASSGPAERVILNLPHEGIKYVPSVARTVAPRGRLYYYEVTSRAEFAGRGEAIVRQLDSPTWWAVVRQRVVHPYSPTSDLASFVFERASGA